MGLRLAFKDIHVTNKLSYWFGRVQLIRKEIPVSTCTYPAVMHYHLRIYVIDEGIREGGNYTLLKTKDCLSEFRRMSEGSFGLRRFIYNLQMLCASTRQTLSLMIESK